MQTDVTERVRVEGEREAAFAAEQAARQEAELARALSEQARADAEQAKADAERAQNRLALMAEATSSLIATLDMDELLDRLAQPVRARGWPTGSSSPSSTTTATCATRRPGTGTAARTSSHEFTSVHVMHLPQASPSRRSMATARPVLLERDHRGLPRGQTSPARAPGSCSGGSAAPRR